MEHHYDGILKTFQCAKRGPGGGGRGGVVGIQGVKYIYIYIWMLPFMDWVLSFVT